MKRIAFIAHLSEVSGAGTALVETVAGLSETYETWLVLPGEGPLAKRARARGIRYVVISNPEVAMLDTGLKQKAGVLTARMGYVRKLKQFLTGQNIDLVYVNSSVSIFPAIAARLAGLPIAWHIHETLDADTPRDRVKKAVIRRLADGLIYASQSGIEHLQPSTGTPAMVARNFVPVAEFASATRQNKHKQEPPLILLNGTFHRKGADVLLQAVDQLHQFAPHLSPVVEITGEGNPNDPYFSQLHTTAKLLALNGRVTFSGLQSGLQGPLQRASVFVSASRNEGLPIAIIEAMAARVPVIATDVGDCAEILDKGKAGWVIPPESPEALALALAEVLSHPELANTRSNMAFEKVSSLYGSSDFWQPLIGFLDQLMGVTPS